MRHRLKLHESSEIENIINGINMINFFKRLIREFKYKRRMKEMRKRDPFIYK